jgi:chromosome segregation ATPase
MAWKFLNIGKANAEIERLEKEVETAKAEAANAKTALETNNSEIAAQLEKVQGELTAANTSLAARTTELSSAKASLLAAQAEVTTLKATIADPKGEIEKRASAKALEITAGQGQPPVGVTSTSSPGATSSGDALLAQLQGITNPVERVEFYRKNKAAIDAAYRK